MSRRPLFQFILFFLNRCSPSFCYKLAEFISDAQYFFSWKDRRAVRSNLKEILPSHENLSYYTREVFRNFGRYLVEFFQMERIVDGAYIRKNVKVQHLEYVQQVLDQGRGGIILTAHLGSWELGAGVLSMLGYPSTVVALPHNEKWVNDLFNRQREAKGLSIISVRQAVRGCLGLLRDNQLVSIVGDRDFNSRGKVMDFLGRKAIVPRGPAIFSIKTGAPIIPVFFLRNSDGTFTFSLEQPISPSDFLNEDSQEDAVEKIMMKYMTIMEKKIRQDPSQWLIFREFWTS